MMEGYSTNLPSSSEGYTGAYVYEGADWER
jgi:hypothetical protein